MKKKINEMELEVAREEYKLKSMHDYTLVD